MWPLLLLACAPECPNGGDKAGGICLVEVLEEPPVLTCPGTLYTSPSPVAPLRSFCGTCDGVDCEWSVATGPEVVAVELDLLGTFADADWSEYHDAFALDAERGVWTARLTRVQSYEAYTSGETTLLDADDPSLTFLWSGLDVEGGYLDCAAGGAAPGDVSGSCRVVQPGE